MAHEARVDQPESSIDCPTEPLAETACVMDRPRKGAGSGDAGADPFSEKRIGDPVFAIDLENYLLLEQLPE